MLTRHIEDTINNTLKDYPITLVTGPRQIGKSTLLYNKFIAKGYTYISLDDSLELAMAKSDPRTFLEIHSHPLIIDEAQKAPGLFVELERIVNESRLKNGNNQTNGMFILSGSQRTKLLEQSEESLSGRVGILDMTNLSLNEIVARNARVFDTDIKSAASRCNIKLSESDLFNYIVRGFFPALYDNLSMNSQMFYSSYLTTYLEKDLKEILKINDDIKFINFLKLLASNTAEELVYDNYSKQIGVSTNTIKAWIASLVKTGIIYLLEPYNEPSIVKRVIKRPKLYFFDTGLAAYLCGIDSAPTLQRSFLKGRFFETFVINEIRKSFINFGIKQSLYYYRDTDQNEIDLVFIRNGVIYCIEVKTGQSFNASSTKAFKKLDNTNFIRGKNAIVCSASSVSILADGSYIIPVISI